MRTGRVLVSLVMACGAAGFARAARAEAPPAAPYLHVHLRERILRLYSVRIFVKTIEALFPMRTRVLVTFDNSQQREYVRPCTFQ